MLTVRLRTRDGLERVQIEPNKTLMELREKISQHIERPVTQFIISTDPSLLTCKDPSTYLDLSEDEDNLTSLGFVNGQMVTVCIKYALKGDRRIQIFCYYDGTREVAPGYKKSVFESRAFGEHMDIPALVAKQVRIERQEAGEVQAASFDRFAAHAFQLYIQSALNFSIKRCGILYGHLAEDKTVHVNVIYEPEQSGKPEHLTYDLDTPEARAADVIAAHLGMVKVGLIFNQSSTDGERDYIMNNEEVWQVCEMQAQVGEHCIAAVFSQLEEDDHKEVHLEAYQCSKQAVELWQDGWMCEPGEEVSNVTKMRNPKEPDTKLPVMVTGNDTDEVDNDFFLVPLAVRDHQGPLMTSFPIENRLSGQASNDLKDHLSRHKQKEYCERLADFHLLLWLATNSGLDISTDMALLTDAVHRGQPVMEGYRMMIDSVAGM